MKRGYRIHICPVGFENDRVCEPLLDPKADKVYLITKDGDHDSAAPYLERINEFLREHEIKSETKYCNISDLTDTLGLYREIFQSEIGNSIFVNVSTGSKIMAIAGMMACMMWDGEPYYAVPESYTTVEQMSIGFKEKIILPHYRIDKPPEEIIECIKFIGGRGDNGTSKKTIIQHLRTKGLLNIHSQERELGDASVSGQGGKPSKPSQAEYKALEGRILKPSREEWKFTTETGNGKSRRIMITDAGTAAIRVFGGKKERED